MRTELISAELYAIPAVISNDSRRVIVSCGDHILTHSLKSGKLIHSTDSLGAKTTRILSRGNDLIVSSKQGSSMIEASSKTGTLRVFKLGEFEVVSVSESLSVVSTVSGDSGNHALGFIEGDLSGLDPVIVPVYTGVVSAVACSKSVIAAVVGQDRRTLLVFDIPTRTTQEYLHPRPLTSVAVHPIAGQVAVGDFAGRIMRFSASKLSEYTSLHHWHSVPVASLAYTASGSVLLSGAEEGVLCVWNESGSETKPQFIPRLGGPIAHISVSKCSQFASVSLKSNRIMVIDVFTRNVQSSICGTLSDGDEANFTRISQSIGAIGFEESNNVVVLSTSSHAQLFDLEARRPVNKQPISITERNHIPATIRARLKARPWQCSHVAVAGANTPTMHLMASLSRNSSKRRNHQLIKIFTSSDAGASWSLNTMCMSAHTDQVVDIQALPTGEFLTASKDGLVKLWQLTKDSSPTWKICRSVSFKNMTPTFLKVSFQGLVIVGFNNLVTLWNPRTLVELTGHGLQLSSRALHADIIPGTTELMSLAQDGTCTVWDLKKCQAIASINCEPVPPRSSATACLVGNRLLVPQEGGIVSCVTYRANKSSKLKLETICVGEKSVEINQISQACANSVVLGSNKGKTIHKITFEEADVASQLPPFRQPDALEQDDMIDENETEAEESHNEMTQQPRKPMIQMNSLISKLFPLEMPLESLGSPEVQFDSLITALTMH